MRISPSSHTMQHVLSRNGFLHFFSATTSVKSITTTRKLSYLRRQLLYPMHKRNQVASITTGTLIPSNDIHLMDASTSPRHTPTPIPMYVDMHRQKQQQQKQQLHSFTTLTSSSSSTFNKNKKHDAMADEYGEMTAEGDTFSLTNFVLENGTVLPHVQLRYQTYGTLNPDTRDNVLVVCHALTGNASLHSWWGDLLGPSKPFDTSRFYVICCNILGSCYGSTSPRSIDPTTQLPYSKNFPDVSIQDTVRLQLLLLKSLDIHSVKSVIGGSFGGMQALEFAAQAGSLQGQFFASDGSPFVKSVIPIACGAAHTAWQIAISEVQRQAIYADPHWNTQEPEKATAGLSVARQIGMVSYRTAQAYQAKFGRALNSSSSNSSSGSSSDTPPTMAYGSSALFRAQSYLQYQGQKFLSRFDPVTYVKLTEQMDSHDLARGRKGKLEQVLSQIEIPALVMGMDSDVLYPLEEQEFLARHLPLGTLQVIHTPDGHDGFLLEQEQVGSHITNFLLN